jgi:hypothetical protein
MDINETLRRLRELSKKILESEGNGDRGEQVEMAELFEALDKWIAAGGFLPIAWDEVSVHL